MSFDFWDLVLLVGCLWWASRVVWPNKDKELKLDAPAVHTDPKYIWIVIERNEAGLFAYNAKKGNYLAHGNTLEEMCSMFKERFPENTGLLVTPISNNPDHLSIKEFTS
jgi:hypothetical protein